MRKINIPKHIDFKPAKEYEWMFERVNNGSIKMSCSEQNLDECPECREDKFKDQKICGWCATNTKRSDFLKNVKR